MKKKVLPLAVGTATAVVMSAANAAMYVNDKGMGETLIFPFYSAETGNSTNVNIANTTDGTKAVKVRIIEAQNSKEVLDFNLYMSPKDHFSFGIMADAADGGGMLKTNDNSCTVPAIPASGVKFRDYGYNGLSPDKADDDPATEKVNEAYDNTSITRTAVGYIEVIEMGQIDPAAVAAIDTATQNKINAAAAIKHDSDGVPANCSILVDAWSTDSAGKAGKWLEEATAGTVGTSEFLASWAGGGLYGYASVVNVANGTSFGYDAIAIADHVGANATGSAMHYEPGDIDPNFTDTAFDTSAIVNNGGTATTVAFTPTVNYAAGVAQVQALNATMMALAVHNDYVTDPGLSASTDWLFTFPTKAFHVNGTEAIEPFSELWTGQSACEYAGMDMKDREESTAPIVVVDQSGGPDFSPKPPPGPGAAPATNGDLQLCYESTIVQFGDSSAIGTDSIAVGVSEFLDSNDGWGTISFDPADLFKSGADLGICGQDGNVVTTGDQTEPCDRQIHADAHTMTGLPVVGFAVQKYVNGDLGSGVLANYAMSTVHKTTINLS